MLMLVTVATIYW